MSIRSRLRFGRRYLVLMGLVLVLLYAHSLTQHKNAKPKSLKQEINYAQKSIDSEVENRSESQTPVTINGDVQANAAERTWDADDPKNASKMLGGIASPFNDSTNAYLKSMTASIMRAYATRQGREYFPYIWQNYDPAVVDVTIKDLKIEAIAVSASDIREADAAVQVVWVGKNAVGEVLYESSRVYFVQDSGEWIPVKLY